MAKLLLINNGYPTIKKPQNMSYIEDIYNCLLSAGVKADLLVITKDSFSLVSKIKNYITFYFKILLSNFSGYDYVYIHHYPFLFAPLAVKFCGMKKVYLHWHGTDLMAGSILKKYLNQLSYVFIKKERIYHITPSAYFKTELHKIIGIPKDRITVSPSGGVNIDLFKPEDTRSDINNGSLAIGYAAELTKEKGAEFLLFLLRNKAVLEKELKKEIIIKYIYYGKEKEFWKERISKFNGTVELEVMEKKHMPSFYNSLNLFIMPTLRKSESLGLVSLESMACGVPVVGPGAFAFKEFINETTGELFIPNNKEDFLRAVKKALVNLDKYSPRDFIVKNYSREKVIQDYKRIFV